MIVYFIVAIRIFSNSLANVFQKKASENLSPLLVNLYSYCLMSIICMFPATQINWLNFQVSFWVYVFCAGFLCTIGTIALIEALKIGELSELAPINSYKSVIGLLSAIILLKEIPTFKEIFAILLIVLGSYILLNDNNLKFGLKIFLRKDIRLRFLALFFTGIEASILKKIILLSNFKTALILWSFSGFLCSLICYFFRKEKFILPNVVQRNEIFIIALTLLIMQLSTNYVFSKINVGISLALFQLSSVTALFFGYKIFQEKHIVRKFIATIIMLLGSTIIIMN